jgi:hypothetical protein
MRAAGTVSVSLIIAFEAVSLPLLTHTAPTVAPTGPKVTLNVVAGEPFAVPVAISGTTAVAGATFEAKNGGRAYVFTKTAAEWRRTAHLKGTDTVANDAFGISVAVSGTTVLVGAPFHANGAGRAYVFTSAAAGWKETAELKGTDTVADDGFGISVALSGTTALVGAPGHANATGRVYVFTHTAAGWKEAAELHGSGPGANEEFGISVALSDNTAIVGAWGQANGTGRAYVFTSTAAGWKQTAELKGSDSVAHDLFGCPVAISDSTAIVGAYVHGGFAGQAYVFTEKGKTWKQTAKLTGTGPLVFEGHYEEFGSSVAVSENEAVVGTYTPGGRAYVFTETATGWNQTAELKGSGTGTFDSEAIDGATVVAGEAFLKQNTGRAYVFTKTGKRWHQIADLKG